MEGKNKDEDKEGNLVHDMQWLSYQSTFDELFHYSGHFPNCINLNWTNLK
jgi:hypothetical protein